MMNRNCTLVGSRSRLRSYTPLIVLLRSNYTNIQQTTINTTQVTVADESNNVCTSTESVLGTVKKVTQHSDSECNAQLKIMNVEWYVYTSDQIRPAS